jgi:hypothetical protein
MGNYRYRISLRVLLTRALHPVPARLLQLSQGRLAHPLQLCLDTCGRGTEAGGRGRRRHFGSGGYRKALLRRREETHPSTRKGAVPDSDDSWALHSLILGLFSNTSLEQGKNLLSPKFGFELFPILSEKIEL